MNYSRIQKNIIKGQSTIMERILIVEDNKTLAKLIAKKISDALNFEVDTAYSLHEAKLFLRMHKYFVTLLDINLPDAPNGEVVDYVLSHNNHAIVLSGNIDKNFRKQMLQKNIIDYVNKSGVDDIKYIINTIQRLQKNQKHKVLVVDDSMIFRKQMKNMLDNLFFNVITVAHGEEALGMLQTHPDTSLVITDYNMPVMDGFQLTQEIRKNHTKEDLAIIALSSNNEDEINALFLKNGANDYITKPFSKEEFSCRINNTIEALENLNIVQNLANRDLLTGLYNRRFFFKIAQDYATESAQGTESYAIAMISIDNFSTIKQTHGEDIANQVALRLANILNSMTSYKDITARFTDDEFCVVLKGADITSANYTLDAIRQEVEKTVLFTQNDEDIRFTISTGATIGHGDEKVDDTISQADMIIYKITQNGLNQRLIEED